MSACHGMARPAGRSVALLTAVALSLTTLITPSLAAATASKGSLASSATDFSAARRHTHRHYHGNGRAAAAVMGMAFGVIGSAIAAQQREEYCENYGCGPRYYYGPGPYYGQPYYGRPYYPY